MIPRTKTLPSASQTVVSISRHLLRLYVTGTTAGSIRAIQRVRRVCDKHVGRPLRPGGNRHLPVASLWPRTTRINYATQTLVKVLPAPLRRLIGDLSNLDSVLFGMDIQERA